MYARTTDVQIQRGKLAEFTNGVESILPALRKQRGFRALLVLRGADPASLNATIISVWDSLQDLKLSESNLFLYQALARILTTSEGFPHMREHQVLLSEFAAD
jgi:heme-degrading monooxygenase HmoA